MRKKLMVVPVLAVLLAAGVPALTSCSVDNKEKHQTQEHAAVTDDEQDIEVIHAAYDTPEAFKSAFGEATEHYLELKDALVESNGKEAQQHGAALEASLNKIDASILEGEAAQKWEETGVTLKQAAAKIAATASLAEQRGAFTELSNKMIAAAEAFGAGTTVYRQYCPMANRNTGGSWLSNNKAVRNPYYGDAMLTCGEVQAAIQDK